MEKIALNSIHKSYYSKECNVKVLENLSLGVKQGEIVSIVGPSGCGKTTLLNIIAGLLKQDSGTVFIDGQEANGKQCPTSIGVIFQDLALFEWNTVRQNIEFPLNLQKIGAEKRKETAGRLVRLAGLDGFENAFPSQLSGGMRQRLAIARALAGNHEVLLMDEPLASLDAQTRELLGEELESILSQSGKTILLVTHSLEEAAFFSDKVVVLSNRPASVKETFEVCFPRPRFPEIKSSTKFHRLKNNIWRSLRSETKKVI